MGWVGMECDVSCSSILEADGRAAGVTKASPVQVR